MLSLRMVAFVAFALAYLAPRLSSADPCAAAFSSASALSQRGLILEARAALIRCSADACPSAMRPLCADDLNTVDARVPTIVPSATVAGEEILDARVSVDGKVIASRLDGKAIELDPGMHVFRVERGASSVEQTLVIREGEKDRILRFALVPPKESGAALPTSPQPVPKAEVQRPIPWTVYAGSAVTVVAAGLWIGFGTSGLVQKGQLDACKGHCEPGAISSATTAFHIADAAGLLSLVGLLVTTTLYATRPTVTVASAPLDHGAVFVARLTF